MTCARSGYISDETGVMLNEGVSLVSKL